jgi:hypothetical protein
MACVHLNQLYQLCKDSQVRLSSSDLIRIVCKQCEKEEVCPSVLFEAYDSHELEENARKESLSESQSQQSD